MADGPLKNKEHPLTGVVLCFTSILPEQRAELAEIASQMGAAHKFDLTSDVTHLLVGETNTAKYKYVARERSDVTVVLPEWIEAIRQSWMQGGDTDLQVLERQYKLPTFFGLTISITGFNDMSFRNYLQETTAANGAEFSKDLTKSVTHLIAREASGAKYDFARKCNIKIVSLKWLEDSLERGMVLEEERYDPQIPSEKQGVDAWNRSLPQRSVKRQQSTNISNLRARKLRRVASTKLGDQNEGIWGDIIGGGFDVTGDGNPHAADSRAEKTAFINARSVIQEVKSFASETTVSDRRDYGMALSDEQRLNESKGFLQDLYIYIHGFSSKQVDVLRNHLKLNGANIADSLSIFSSLNLPKTGRGLYIIVPHKLPGAEIPSTDDMAFECEIVTDLWLERCLDSKTLVPPEAHVTSTPFPRFPIPGFSGMKICSTGFAGMDLLHLSKLVAVMGATYEEFLTPSASVLICNNPHTANVDKLRHTLEWGVPAVSADWLWISVQTGHKKSFDQYLVHEPKLKSGTEQNGSGQPNDRSEHRIESISSKEIRPAPEQPTTSRTESTSFSTKDDAFKLPSTTEQGYKSQGNLGDLSMNLHKKSISRSPSKSLGGDETSVRREAAQDTSVKNTSRSLGFSLSGLLKQAREFTRASSGSGLDGSGQQRRRPILGRTSSLSSARNGPTKGISRASSVDTLNEDGYGSAVDSVDTDSHNRNSLKQPPTFRGGQSFNSILSAGKYVDSPLYEEEDRQRDEGGTPPMTQLNYEDEDAVAMREEFMKRGRNSGSNSENMKKPPKKAMVVGEIKDLDIGGGGWGTGRRTRRAGKSKESNNDNNIF